MTSVPQTTFEIEDPCEAKPEPPVKNKILYGMFVTSSILAPYAEGAVILFNEKKLKEWNWI